MCAHLVITAPIGIPPAGKSKLPPKKCVPRCEFWAFAIASHNCERFLDAHSPRVGAMSRRKVRLKPTRRGTRAQCTAAREFKRDVRFVSQPGRGQAPDLLRRLEREVGPLADALTTAKPRRVLLRALLRTAIGGLTMAAVVIAWQHIPSDAPNTETTGGTISQADEVAGPLAALVAPEAENSQLQVWHEDSDLLLYRSPWRP
jgi:hypothetical protein